MIIYPFITIILLGILLTYFYIARRLDIVDRPNERSSHLQPTIRGGGIIFPDAAILWFLLAGFQQPWAIGGLFVIALVSLFDDLWGTPRGLRFLVHLVAVSLLFLQLNIAGLPWYLLVSAYILTIGWINAFNFMDGINGITPFYSLAALGTFIYVNRHIGFIDAELLFFLVIAVVLFAWFNARKNARTFAGDVGSISMAFLLAWIMIALILKTGQPAWILLFAVYGIDSAITILARLRRKENIFRAHRSHLYQLLANEHQWPHLKVAILYALSQAIINIAVIFLVLQGIMTTPLFLAILAIIALTYIIIRINLEKAPAQQT